MDQYIENAIKEIEDHWFNNHVSELGGNKDCQVLYWREEGTRNYFTKYLFTGGDLIVTGDIGEAVYCLTEKATLQNVNDYNLSYLMGKLRAHSDDRWDFDEKKAREEDLKEWYEEVVADGNGDDDAFKELYGELVDATGQWTRQDYFQTAVFSIYERTTVDWFDGETAAMVAQFGARLPYRFIAYWQGLRMAIEQLETNKVQHA